MMELKYGHKIFIAILFIAILLLSAGKVAGNNTPKFLSGVIYDSELQPLENVTLTVNNLNNGWLGTTKTNSAGYFEIIITKWSEGNTVNIIATIDGYITISIFITLDGSFFQMVEIQQFPIQVSVPEGKIPFTIILMMALLMIIICILIVVGFVRIFKLKWRDNE